MPLFEHTDHNHKRFTDVSLLATHLANLTESFQLSFTINVFLRKQHKVVYNQCLYIDCKHSIASDAL